MNTATTKLTGELACLRSNLLALAPAIAGTRDQCILATVERIEAIVKRAYGAKA